MMGDTFEAGRQEGMEEIARWHDGQGRGFRDLAAKLERDRASVDDVRRASWASASHHAHAAHIRRWLKPMSPPR